MFYTKGQLKAQAIASAVSSAQVRKMETGQTQVVYESQPGHFIHCSSFAWGNGQNRITPKLVQIV